MMFMKKMWAYLLALTILLSLSACGSGSPAPASSGISGDETSAGGTSAVASDDGSEISSADSSVVSEEPVSGADTAAVVTSSPAASSAASKSPAASSAPQASSQAPAASSKPASSQKPAPASSTPASEKPSSTPPTPSDSGSSNAAFAAEVVRLCNIERANNGLPALSAGNSTLTAAAQKRATEIVQSFSHTRPDGRSTFTVLADYGISYRAAGENIAYGQSTPAEVVEGWMNSSGHRANILNSAYTQIGVGCYSSGGRLYWTQLFINPR